MKDTKKEDKIYIKVTSQTYEEIEFSISRQSQFKKLFARYCERNNLK